MSAEAAEEERMSAVKRIPATKLLFHSPSHQQTYEHRTIVSNLLQLKALPQADRATFKAPADVDEDSVFALFCTSTIFHPQGGGQPSDVGEIIVNGSHPYEVIAARTSATNPGTVMHFGRFKDQVPSDCIRRSEIVDQKAVQKIDPEKRRLYSRLHTAGHVLGAATRQLLEDKIENFDELKASHFPDSAACEFQGLIEGKWKGDIQTSVDQLVKKGAEVRIKWWTKSDFRSRGLERLLINDEDWQAVAVAADEDGNEVNDSNGKDDEKTRIRVVEIVGTEVYPCGGTHVRTSRECGKVTVRKIGRSKGSSRVSYNVDV